MVRALGTRNSRVGLRDRPLESLHDPGRVYSKRFERLSDQNVLKDVVARAGIEAGQRRIRPASVNFDRMLDTGAGLGSVGRFVQRKLNEARDTLIDRNLRSKLLNCPLKSGRARSSNLSLLVDAVTRIGAELFAADA